MSAEQQLADSKRMTDNLLSKIASLEKLLKVGANQVMPEQPEDKRDNHKTS